MPSPRLSSPRAGRRSDGASPTLRHDGRRSGGANVPPLPPLHVNRRSGGATVPPLPPLHVSRRSDGATPRPTPSPLVPALYTRTQASRHAANLTTHGPTLGIRFMADRTPKTGKRLPRPNSESVGHQSSSAGVRSRGLVLLGSLHVELSSWRRGKPPPPPAARATTGTGGSGGGLVHFTPDPGKTMGATRPCSSAHRHLYSNRSTGGPVRYSKGSVGDHRSRGSNQLLRGARRVRYLQGGCLQRCTGTQLTEQAHPTHQSTHRPHQQAGPLQAVRRAAPTPSALCHPAVGMFHWALWTRTPVHHSNHSHPSAPTLPTGRSSVRIGLVMVIRRADA